MVEIFCCLLCNLHQGSPLTLLINVIAKQESIIHVGELIQQENTQHFIASNTVQNILGPVS
jgi:hypothetical protein